MYVCIEVALCGGPMGLGVQLGLGDGSHEKWVLCPNRAGTIRPASHTLAHTCTLCVLSVANSTMGS